MSSLMCGFAHACATSTPSCSATAVLQSRSASHKPSDKWEHEGAASSLNRPVAHQGPASLAGPRMLLAIHVILRLQVAQLLLLLLGAQLRVRRGGGGSMATQLAMPCGTLGLAVAAPSRLVHPACTRGCRHAQHEAMPMPSALPPPSRERQTLRKGVHLPPSIIQHTPRAPTPHLLVNPLGIIVQHNEVAVRHVEARQMVARRLGVVDVVVRDVGRAARLLGGASARGMDGPRVSRGA